MRISVIVITYNRPAALERVLQGLATQRSAPCEVIVGDDGSAPTARQCVRAFGRSRQPNNIVHVHQQDKGFRAGQLRNKCVARSTGDFLLFLDGDCIPRPGFVAGYRRRARAGEFLFGRRVLVNREWTREIERHGSDLLRPRLPSLVLRRLRGEINSLLKLYLAPVPMARTNSRRWKRMRSCNFGIWRTDFLAVNGFDEAYEGWGFEDSDLTLRLQNHGVRLAPAPASTAVFHLWHDEAPREFAGANWDRLETIMRSDTTWAKKGVATHLRQPDQASGHDRGDAA